MTEGEYKELNLHDTCVYPNVYFEYDGYCDFCKLKDFCTASCRRVDGESPLKRKRNKVK